MWYLYILRCRDKSLYTGITTDVERRLKEHNAGKGSRAVRGKRPAVLVYRETIKSRSLALKKEAQIKKLTHAEKLTLANSWSERPS